ncbi:MAG: HD-GYP domain-containing protein [Candidatus Omnitrophica bacterium]|nr:HD-GYP domain-containing protein [Candidatus Omnitrophota bacterium]
MSKQNKEKKYQPFLSGTFKLWIVAIIFIAIGLHLYAIKAYPQAIIISSEIILGIVLVLVAYLWVQELRDRYRLQALNKALVSAQKQLQQAEIDTITVLILTEEAKDSYVRGHTKRVARYSLAIATAMGFSKEDQDVIERAGILHDLGKIGISDSILKKPGKLNDEEWKIMKSHPQRGLEILKPLKFLPVEKEIILHHHERYAGGGYPDGIKGEAIPIGARIMAVADTFDAMNSARSYRKPLSKEAILSELKKVSGGQLDPSAVSIFLDLLGKNPYFWERD